MTAQEFDNSERDRRVDAAIASYLHAVDTGQDMSTIRFLAGHRDVAAELTTFVINYEQFEQWATMLRPPEMPGSPSTDNAATLLEREATPLPAVESGHSADKFVTTDARRFGDYELLEEIARGGMGVVYKARQISLNRIVALKMILAGQFAGEEDVQRFYTEAEAAANLDHPGIVPIFEVGQHEDQHYFSMGFVDGESLAEQIAHRPLPPNEAALLLKQVAEAVQYAHDQGVIHRDLKPANILLERSGDSSPESPEPEIAAPGRTQSAIHDSASASSGQRVRITDFGLAKQVQTDSGLTATGQILGTPGYMPPEQAAGKIEQVKETADVYALGAVLYAMLTGGPPFQANNPLDTLLQVLEREPVAPRQLNPTVPLDLETICLKCLEKDRARRYQSTQQLAEELERFLNGEPILARPITTPMRLWLWCKRNPVVAGLTTGLAVALVTGLVGVTWQWIRAEVNAQRARQETQRANREAARATAEERRTRRTLYVAHMRLAEQAWDSAHIGQVLELLDRQRPSEEQKDLRDFEWYYWRRKCHQYTTEFRGHTGQVTSVAVSPDGKRIASAAGDRTIKLWGLDEGQLLKTLRGHTKLVRAVAFSPDGQTLASASLDGTVKLWDVADGRAIREFQGHRGRVDDVAISPDGRTVASAGADRTVRVWNVDGEKPPAVFEGHEDTVWSVEFLPGSRKLVSAGSDGTVRLWDVITGESLWDTEIHHDTSRPLVCVSTSADGRRFAAGDTEGVVHILDVQTGAVTQTLNGHADAVRSVAFSSDSALLASASTDGTVRLWSTEDGALKEELKGHAAGVYGVAFSPDGRWLVTGSLDRTVKLWDVRATLDQTRDLLVGHTASVESVAFAPDGRTLVTADGNGAVRFWDTATGDVKKTINAHSAAVLTLAVTPDGRLLASGSADRTVKLWNWSSGELVRTLRVHKGRVSCVAFSRDGGMLASGSFDNTVELWDVMTGEELFTLTGHRHWLMSLAFLPDGETLASASRDRTVKLWDITSGRQLTSIRHSGYVRSMAISPDGKTLATPSFENTIKFRDLSTGQSKQTLLGHSDYIHSLVFSPNGKTLFSASADNTIKLWDGVTGELKTTLKGHLGAVKSLALSPDATILASASSDHTVRLWRADRDR